MMMPPIQCTPYVSISIGSTGTLINYDQWENGYDGDLASPTDLYSSSNSDGTQIGATATVSMGSTQQRRRNIDFTCDLYGHPATVDALAAGNVVVLRNAVPTANPSLIDFDGRDKFGSTSRLLSAASTGAQATSTTGAGTCLGGAVEVYPTADWGVSYVSPVGTNQTYSEMFRYTALTVQASHPGTVVTVDANGATAGGLTTSTLGEGESIVVADIQQGATVTATFPVQVHLLTGDPDSLPYEYSIYTLFPRPSGKKQLITVRSAELPCWMRTKSSRSRSITQVRRHSMCAAIFALRSPMSTILQPMGHSRWQCRDDSGAHCYAVTADNGSTLDSLRQFFAIGTVDSANLQGDANSGGIGDLGFTLSPDAFLAPQALVGLGIGQDPNSSSTQNGSPVWVTPVCPVDGLYIYLCRSQRRRESYKVDLNGNNNFTDNNVDGFADFDEPTSNTGLKVSVLQSIKLRDPSDQDRTGMRIWSETAANDGGAVGCDLAIRN